MLQDDIAWQDLAEWCTAKTTAQTDNSITKLSPMTVLAEVFVAE